jgi:hypothetical protein
MLAVLNLRTWTMIGQRIRTLGVSFSLFQAQMATAYCGNGDEGLRL